MFLIPLLKRFGVGAPLIGAIVALLLRAKRRRDARRERPAD
ncbi:MAG TPA: hypothetical protein VID68_13760 [Solirubrobacteraceae bacterium]